MNDLRGKVVLITGGSSGYGKASAELFVKENAKVIIAARNEQALIEAKKETGCADYISMDVTKYEDWEKAYEFIKEKYGTLDILVNNAGGGVSICDTVDQTPENIDKSIALNLNSVIYGSKVFGAMMKANRSGTIINVSSVCAKEAWAGFSVYAAAKWGVLGFSKGLYVELRPYDVRVTCMVPASANTGFQRNANVPESGPMLLKPSDIAEAILFTCKLSDKAVVEEMTVWGIDQEVNPL